MNENETTLRATPGNDGEWIIVDEEGFIVARVRDEKGAGSRAEGFARLFARSPLLKAACVKSLDIIVGSNVEGVWLNCPHTPEQTPVTMLKEAIESL